MPLKSLRVDVISTTFPSSFLRLALNTFVTQKFPNPLLTSNHGQHRVKNQCECVKKNWASLIMSLFNYGVTTCSFVLSEVATVATPPRTCELYDLLSLFFGSHHLVYVHEPN